MKDINHLIVPAILLYEVFKNVLHKRGEQQTLQVAGAMHAGKVVPVDAESILISTWACSWVSHALPATCRTV